MAAADYYNTAPTSSATHQSSPYLAPQQPQHSAYMNQSPQFSQQLTHNAPPPYQPVEDPHKPSVHFAPPPQQHRPSSFSNTQRPSFSSHQRPNPQSWDQPQYPPQNIPQSMPPHRPSVSFENPPPQPGYPPSHMRPPYNPNMSQLSLEGGGYSSDPESHRRHRKHREGTRSRDRSRDIDRDERPIHERSRSTKADSFLGAAGGGLIGDLIFPGLGTIGGAALGWWGGKDYGKHRKWREQKRDREQVRWERKHGDSSGDRSPDRSHDHLHPDPERRRNRRRHSDY